MKFISSNADSMDLVEINQDVWQCTDARRISNQNTQINQVCEENREDPEWV